MDAPVVANGPSEEWKEMTLLYVSDEDVEDEDLEDEDVWAWP